MNAAQVEELLYQALETELGGVQVYEMAISCAVNEDLRKEWEKYLSETENHVRIVTDVFNELGLDTSTESPGRQVVRHKGESLLKAMELANSPVIRWLHNWSLPNVLSMLRPRIMPTGSSSAKSRKRLPVIRRRF